MGGISESSWRTIDWQGQGKDFAQWQGILRVEGGGFCGTVIRSIDFDVAGFDGIQLRVQGDGNRYKFRLKPADMANRNEFQYQASFDTVKGQWIDVHLPFEAFTAVRRNDVAFGAVKVNKGPAGTKMSSIGFVFSRFEYDEVRLRVFCLMQ